MSATEEIITVAVLKEKSKDRYELVARWFLGKSDRLPRYDDEFRVRVSLINSNRFLKPDGTFGAPGDDHYISVMPKNEAMLDPPRKAEDIPGGFPCKDQWYAAKTPTRPVDRNSLLQPTFKISAQTLVCLKTEEVPLTVIELLKSVTSEYPTQEAFKAEVIKVIGDANAALYMDTIVRHSAIPTEDGFGVYHLLTEAQPSRVQWRVSRQLLTHVDETLKRQQLMGRSYKHIGRPGEDLGETIAVNLARHLVRGGPRPAYLPDYLLSAYRALQSETEQFDPATARSQRNAEDIFSFGNNRLGDRWEYASIVIDALKDAGLRERLDKAIDEPQKVRQHLRLRGAQGGRLLDYWCMPAPAAPCTGELTRGRQYPASELIGLGLTIGDFSRSDVQSWIDESNKDGARLKIAVSHVGRVTPPPPSLRGPRSDVPGDFFEEDRGDGLLVDRPYYVDNKALSNMLKEPANFGSTAPPQLPMDAFVNYDLVQTNAGVTDEEADKIGRQVGYRTGDGRVEMFIKAVPSGKPGEEKARAVGFNIYGMWEEPSTQSFFDNPSKKAQLDDLRPWLITRRYSYERDLKGAFPAEVVADILAKPPWQALLEAAADDKWVDEKEQAKLRAAGRAEKEAELPNLTDPPGYTIFALDIRAGMDSGLSGSTRKFVGWDTRGALKSTWDIEKKRDDNPAGARPQRYRFWVTTVDCFEQESAPLAVRTNDVDAGQTTDDYLFTPVRRAALLAPSDREVPATTALPTGGRGLYHDKKSNKLIVYWETPFLNDTAKFNLINPSAGNEDHKPLKLANKDDLFGTVVVYRRRLRHKIEETRPSLRVSGFELERDGSVNISGRNILALPQWVEEIERLENDPTGAWTRFAEKLDVLPGATDFWTAEFPLTHADRGYDYIAVLSVAVRREKMSFWAPNVVVANGGRRVQLIKRKDKKSDYTLHLKRISETPGVSDAVCTKSLPLPNPERPRGLELGADLRFHPTKPIPSPPGIARDMVLLKLLKHAFKDNSGPVPTVPWHTPWSEPGAASVLQLTQGQADMINATIERTVLRITEFKNGRGLADPSLVAAKWILASDFASTGNTSSPADTYRQHQTVGFRGLQEVSFTYKPLDLKTFPPAPNESEAVRFRIYAMRVPLNSTAADNYTTVKVENCEQLGRKSYKLNIPRYTGSGDDPYKAMRPIEDNSQPTMARITPIKGGKPQEENAIFGVIAGLKRVGDYLEAEFAFPQNEMPDLQPRANIRLFMAQPIYSVQSKQFEPGAPKPTEPERYKLLMPVGGGHPEVFCWWVVSVSAQEVETDHGTDRRPFVMLRCDYGSIEPTPPRMMRLSTPLDRVEHSLDPVKYKDWLPEQAQPPGVAMDAPRLIVSWEAYDRSSAIYISIDRDQVKAAQQEDRLRLTADDLKPWRAILAIEKASEDEPLQIEWLRSIRDNWLMGETVKVEQDSMATGADVTHIGVNHEPRLSGHEGLKLIQIDPSSTERRPAFIDYFRFPLPKDRVRRMDSNWLYRYRLVAYIDLGATIPDEEWRYLKSRPSEWTEERLPETTPIEVKPGKPTLAASALGPEVALRLMTSASSFTALSGEAQEEEWRYRIIVRRKRNFSIRTAPKVSTDLGWEDVGAPVSLWPAPGQLETIVDANIERADIDREAVFTYQVSVNEFVKPAGGSGADEVLIRSQGAPSEFTVTIPAPANPDVEEVRVVVPIEIG